MAGNRVDELEAKVQELQATIDGLTDELVETKERLHALEGVDDGTPDILEGRPTRGEAQQETATEAPSEAAEESPADDGEASVDDGNSDEADGEDNADSESGDDIIVA